MPVEGTVPAYQSPLPENLYRAAFPAFPSWQAFADAIYRIYDSEIGYIAHRQFIMWGEELQAAFLKIVTAHQATVRLQDLLEMPEIQKLTEEMRRNFQLILVGMTPRDLEYQQKVFDRILRETGGWNIALVDEPPMQRYVLLYMIKLCFKNLNFIASGGFIDTYNSVASPDLWASGEIEAGRVLLKKYAGLRIADAGDQAMGPISGQGGGGVIGWEDFLFYDPQDPASVNAAREVSDEGDRLKAEKGRPPGGMVLGLARTTHADEEIRAKKLSKLPEYRWQRTLKQMLDPNGVGSGNYFWGAEPSKEGLVSEAADFPSV